MSSLLSRCCRELLIESREALGNSQEGISDEEVVHDLRVLTKKLRAAWKIARAAVGKPFQLERAEALREFSERLAGDRDLAVLFHLSHELSERWNEPAFREVIDHLEGEMKGGQGEETQEILLGKIDEEMSAWSEVVFEDLASELRAHRGAIRESRLAARNHTRLALRDSDAELWHDWRKEVKRLRYQREFLAAIQGRKPGIRDLRIARLGSRLGDRNDLANLTKLVEQLGNRPELRKVLAAEERLVMNNCRRLGRRNLANG